MLGQVHTSRGQLEKGHADAEALDRPLDQAEPVAHVQEQVEDAKLKALAKNLSLCSSLCSMTSTGGQRA